MDKFSRCLSFSSSKINDFWIFFIEILWFFRCIFGWDGGIISWLVFIDLTFFEIRCFTRHLLLGASVNIRLCFVWNCILNEILIHIFLFGLCPRRIYLSVRVCVFNKCNRDTECSKLFLVYSMIHWSLPLFPLNSARNMIRSWLYLRIR